MDLNNKDKIIENTVILGALLHDIGKAIMKKGSADYANELAGKHPVIGERYINKILDEIKEEYKVDPYQAVDFIDLSLLKSLIRYHHEGQDFYDSSGSSDLDCHLESAPDEHKPLCYIVSRSDNFQSAERGEKDKKDITGYTEKQSKSLGSIFSIIKRGGDNLFYDLRGLVYNNFFENNKSIILPTNLREGTVSSLMNDFQKSFEEFFKRYIIFHYQKQSFDFQNFLQGIILLLEKYLWCIPSDITEKYPTVSLLEHLKFTASLSHCRYIYYREKSELNNSQALKDNERKFLRLIIGDFSGIQKYIYNISKIKTAAKRLRGRSLFVQFISEDIKRYILRELNLTSLNVLTDAGGKFVILAPNIKDIEEKFSLIKNNIEKKIFDKFKGELIFNLVLSKGFSGKEFEKIGEYLDSTFRQLTKISKSPMKSVLVNSDKWNQNNFIVNYGEDIKYKDICKLCGRYLIDKKFVEIAGKINDSEVEDICRNCGQDIILGENIGKAKYLVWQQKDQTADNNKEDKGDNIQNEIDLLFSKLLMIENKRQLSGITNREITIVNPGEKDLEDNKEFFEVLHTNKVNVNFLANYIPGNPSFENIAERDGRSFNKLAILKGDVDDLGKIFVFGLRNIRDKNKKEKKDYYDNLNYTASRIKTLSLMFNLFFEGFLNKFISDKFKNCYILYSGGDDFVIIGRWNEIIDLTIELEKYFNRFVSNNPDIHFSASIYLFGSKEPIFHIIKQAESALEEAKQKDSSKHKINIFSRNINNIDFANLIQVAKEFYNQYLAGEKRVVSRSYLYFLLKIAEWIEEEKRNKNKPLKRGDFINLWSSQLIYSLNRNFRTSSGNSPKDNFREWCEAVLLGKQNQAVEVKEEEAKTIKDNFYIFVSYLIYLDRDNN